MFNYPQLLFHSCMKLGTFLNPSVPQFSHLSSGHNTNVYSWDSLRLCKVLRVVSGMRSAPSRCGLLLSLSPSLQLQEWFQMPWTWLLLKPELASPVEVRLVSHLVTGCETCLATRHSWSWDGVSVVMERPWTSETGRQGFNAGWGVSELCGLGHVNRPLGHHS